MTRLLRSSCALLVAAAATGCASNSDKIAASYVSPVSYESWTCRQLQDEAQRVSSRAAQLAGLQDQRAGSDAVATGVAVVFVWPAAFLAKGEGASTAGLGRLKGEMDAFEQASIRKDCGILFLRA